MIRLCLTACSVLLSWGCESLPGVGEFQTAFILARAPELPSDLTLPGLQQELVSLGVDANTVAGLTATLQGPTCNYNFTSSGY